MRRVLGHWERSGLTLREFAQQRGMALCALSWWRRVLRDAGAEDWNGSSAENPVVFTAVE
jgi:hypothetical protein